MRAAAATAPTTMPTIAPSDSDCHSVGGGAGSALPSAVSWEDSELERVRLEEDFVLCVKRREVALELLSVWEVVSAGIDAVVLTAKKVPLGELE
jgi:predicted CxxxxCH...CXXCH cytochrome family protein